MLLNIETLEWDEDLLDILKVPRTILPKVVESSGKLAVTSKRYFRFGDSNLCGIGGINSVPFLARFAGKKACKKILMVRVVLC
ncbi:MAG: FGGY family carbohydrate kinase [Saprospiraceae bacterium]